jgi:hypothetical protein
MVSRKEYERITADAWKQIKVKTKQVLRNGFMSIPTGTICKIHGKGGGFELETEPCKCCGVSIWIRKVNPEHVKVWGELIE